MANKFDTVSPILIVKTNNRQVALWNRRKVSYVIFETSLGQCLLIHGCPDGSLECPDIDTILEYNLVDFIICCYPAKVIKRYPHLKSLMAWEDCPEVTWTTIWHRNQGSYATFIMFGLDEKQMQLPEYMNVNTAI